MKIEPFSPSEAIRNLTAYVQAAQMAFTSIQAVLRLADREGDATVKLALITEHVQKELDLISAMVKPTAY